jgi:hypothetical protein
MFWISVHIVFIPCQFIQHRYSRMNWNFRFIRQNTAANFEDDASKSLLISTTGWRQNLQPSWFTDSLWSSSTNNKRWFLHVRVHNRYRLSPARYNHELVPHQDSKFTITHNNSACVGIASLHSLTDTIVPGYCISESFIGHSAYAELYM